MNVIHNNGRFKMCTECGHLGDIYVWEKCPECGCTEFTVSKSKLILNKKENKTHIDCSCKANGSFLKIKEFENEEFGIEVFYCTICCSFITCVKMKNNTRKEWRW